MRQLRQTLLKRKKFLSIQLAKRQCAPPPGEGGAQPPGFEGYANPVEMALVELGHVDAALRRMEAGAYGFCLLCGKEIPMNHLRAVPWIALCLRCLSGSA